MPHYTWPDTEFWIKDAQPGKLEIKQLTIVAIKYKKREENKTAKQLKRTVQV